jgi:cytochrome c-type biogenesis protein CcmH/NrfG
VPGWPVGFGDDEKAEKLLKQALAINPTGIDPNFFYGDFLLDQGDKAQAKVYLDKALAAPARPGREVADEGRRRKSASVSPSCKHKQHSVLFQLCPPACILVGSVI